MTSDEGSNAEATDGLLSSHRADIDGLRAVAVVLVVLFHSDVAAFGGGFVGVDVFFVISGYLISQLLVREVGDGGTVRLPAFWLRRIRRLVPALAVVVTATCVISTVVYSPLEWSRVTRDGIASMLYVSNAAFALDATQYFQHDAPSPFLHLWSLAVEEQFYVLWPIGILVLSRIARASRVSLTRGVAAGMVLASLGSFAVSLVLSARGTPWAFFGLPTRVWEFGLGGLAGIFTPAIGQRSDLLRAAGGWIGLALVAVAATTLEATTPYPGLAALLPVVGTVLVLASGAGVPAGPASVLSWRTLQRVGRVSYSWYLWHWPLIVFTIATVDGADTMDLLAASLVGLVLAAATLRMVENPFRYDRRWAPPRRLLAAAAAMAAIALASAVSVGALGRAKIQDDPRLARLELARSDATELDMTACSLSGARPRTGSIDDGLCVFGDSSGAATVVLLGDSHAAHWLPALDVAARDLGLRLVPFLRNGCPPWDVEITAEGSARRVQGCTSHRAEAAELVARLEPAAVVVAGSSYPGRLLDADARRVSRSGETDAWTAAISRTVDQLEPRRLGVILDNPSVPNDPVECAAHRGIEACTPSRADALAPSDPKRLAERTALARLEDTVLFDTVPLLCDSFRCHLEKHGMFAFADRTHITASLSAALGVEFVPFVRELVGPPS
jgi:peptidoglycan/LPS O-acetylase OafA/YrhL